MDPPFPTHSIETDSNSTMTTLMNSIALMLKYKLETALYKSHQETAMNEMKYLLVKKGIFHKTKRDWTIEKACEEDIQEWMAT